MNKILMPHNNTMFKRKQDELKAFFVDKLLGIRNYGSIARFNFRKEDFNSLKIRDGMINYTGLTPCKYFVGDIIRHNRLKIKENNIWMPYYIKTNYKSYLKGHQTQTRLHKAMGIVFHSVHCNNRMKKEIISPHGDKETRYYAEIWSMPMDSLRFLREFISWNRCLMQKEANPSLKLEGLTFPHGERFWYACRMSDTPDSYLSRYYSVFTYWKKSWRYSILAHCGEFYEIDINSCASQRIAKNINNQEIKKSILDKIKSDTFYIAENRKEHKTCVNKLIFSQISRRKRVPLRYNHTTKRKHKMVTFLLEHAAITPDEADCFICSMLDIVYNQCKNDKGKAHAELLSLEKYMEEFQEINQTEIDGVPVVVDILRVHDCLYVKGADNARRFTLFLDAVDVLYSVERVVPPDDKTADEIDKDENKLKNYDNL